MALGMVELIARVSVGWFFELRIGLSVYFFKLLGFSLKNKN